MEQWELVCRIITTEKDNIVKAYKNVSRSRYIRQETVRKHTETIVNSLENIREVIGKNLTKFTTEHREQLLDEYWSLRDLLVKTLDRHNLTCEITHDIGRPIQLNLDTLFAQRETEKLVPILEEENPEIEIEIMPQTVVEFLNTASKLIPDYDGKYENLRSFLDALSLVTTIKDTHEAVAISLIKTKLKGNARNLIDGESTIDSIISKLQRSVKGESVEVLSAKMMNIRQNNKSANVYCGEIEALAKTLESAYISDGLTTDLAAKYSTREAVKAMTKNCTIDKVKLIMEAGQFSNMNEAIGKFVSSCTGATGQQNSILHLGSRPKFNDNRRGRGNYRGGRRNGGNWNRNGNPNNGNNNWNRRGQGRNWHNNRNGHNNGRNNNTVRTTNSEQDSSENPNEPLR